MFIQVKYIPIYWHSKNEWNKKEFKILENIIKEGGRYLLILLYTVIFSGVLLVQKGFYDH